MTLTSGALGVGTNTLTLNGAVSADAGNYNLLNTTATTTANITAAITFIPPGWDKGKKVGYKIKGGCKMRKIAVAMVVLFSVSLCFSAVLYAEGVDKAMKELSSNIAKEAGLTESEQKSINNPVKEMLEQGADKDDIRSAVSGMAKKGIRDEDLKSSVESMKDLVKSGRSPKDAGNIVSQAAHQAKADGLKGKDLANKVHQAVKEMQAEKREKQETKLQEKDEREKQKESQEHGSSMGNKGMGGSKGAGGMGGGRGRR